MSWLVGEEESYLAMIHNTIFTADKLVQFHDQLGNGVLENAVNISMIEEHFDATAWNHITHLGK